MMDEFDRKRLKQIHETVELLVKQQARLQDQVTKSLKRKSDSAWGRRYLRKIVHSQRELIAQQKAYIFQLENELKLHGLE